MNIDERVRNFLISWSLGKENLNKLLEEERDGESINDGPGGSEIPSPCRDHDLQACGE